MLSGKEFPVYYDSFTSVLRTQDSKPVQALSVEAISGVFRLQSLHRETTWISCFDEAGVQLGNRIVLEKDDKKQGAYAMDYIFDQKLLDQKPTFVTWDYAQESFKIL